MRIKHTRTQAQRGPGLGQDPNEPRALTRVETGPGSEWTKAQWAKALMGWEATRDGSPKPCYWMHRTQFEHAFSNTAFLEHTVFSNTAFSNTRTHSNTRPEPSYIYIYIYIYIYLMGEGGVGGWGGYSAPLKIQYPWQSSTLGNKVPLKIQYLEFETITNKALA